MPTTLCTPSLDSEVKSGFFPIAFAGRAMRDGAARVTAETPRASPVALQPRCAPCQTMQSSPSDIAFPH